MSESTERQPILAPTGPDAAGCDRSAGPAATTTTQVMLRLTDDGYWPPYPAETVAARMVGMHQVELLAAPWFATGLSRGDLVAVHHDGIGLVAEDVLIRGGRSTVHVVATDFSELEELAPGLIRAGADVVIGGEPPMLIADVPADADLAAIVDVLRSAEGFTLAYDVSCRQHG